MLRCRRHAHDRKPHRGKEKAKGAAAAGAAAEVVVEKCDEAAAAGRVDARGRGEAVRRRPSREARQENDNKQRAWRCSSSRAAAEVGASRPCLTGNTMLAGRRLNAALAARRAGRRADLRARGRRRATTSTGGGGGAGVRSTSLPRSSATADGLLPPSRVGGGAATARSTSEAIFVRLSRRGGGRVDGGAFRGRAATRPLAQGEARRVEPGGT